MQLNSACTLHVVNVENNIFGIIQRLFKESTCSRFVWIISMIEIIIFNYQVVSAPLVVACVMSKYICKSNNKHQTRDKTPDTESYCK